MKAQIKKLLFPITVASILLLISVVYSAIAIYIALSSTAEAAIYAAIAIPISLLLVVVFLIDRMLLRRFSYVKVLLAETIFFSMFVLFFLYQNRSVQYRFQTGQDAVLVLYDADENPSKPMKKTGLFSREMVIDKNILHLKPAMVHEERLRMRWPENWTRFSVDQGILLINGDSVPYLFSTQNLLGNRYYQKPEAYIDSIFQIRVATSN